MALDTYANLQTALADHIGSRADVSAATIRDFITMFEARANRILRVRRATGRADASITDQYLEVPPDFGGPISAVLTDQSPPVHLEWVTPARLNDLIQNVYGTTAGIPAYYATIGAEFAFVPTPQATFAVELTYYKTVAALTDANTTNWLLTNHPDLYVNGTLAEMGPYLVEDPRLPQWMAARDRAIEEVLQGSLAEVFGGWLNVMPNTLAVA